MSEPPGKITGNTGSQTGDFPEDLTHENVRDLLKMSSEEFLEAMSISRFLLLS